MKSVILVVLQFSSIFALVWFGDFPQTLFSLLLFSAGGCLGIVSIAWMRFDNLRIFPEPKKNIRLVTSGPYRFIRHPMYTSVLMTMSAFVDSADLLSAVMWLVLFVSILGKIRIEERLLPLFDETYVAYRQRTWKLLPFIF